MPMQIAKKRTILKLTGKCVGAKNHKLEIGKSIKTPIINLIHNKELCVWVVLQYYHDEALIFVRHIIYNFNFPCK